MAKKSVYTTEEMGTERDYVVVVTSYGGHEADTAVFGSYTEDEALAKLRALAGDANADAAGAYGGLDYDDGDRTISITRLIHDTAGEAT